MDLIGYVLKLMPQNTYDEVQSEIFDHIYKMYRYVFVPPNYHPRFTWYVPLKQGYLHIFPSAAKLVGKTAKLLTVKYQRMLKRISQKQGL